MQVPTNVFPDKPALPSRELLLLSLREWEALLYIADDLSNEEIAPNLCVTPKSIANYRNRIGDKLQQKGTGKLARFARKHREALRYWYLAKTGKLPPPTSE